MDYSQKSLEQSLQSLSLVNETLKKEKWNSIGHKVWIGVGGIGVGLLIGLLISK